MNSQKTPHISPFRASYGVSFMSTSTEIDRVIKGFYCICTQSIALGTRTMFQFGVLIRSAISAIYKFRENILESLRKVSEIPPVSKIPSLPQPSTTTPHCPSRASDVPVAFSALRPLAPPIYTPSTYTYNNTSHSDPVPAIASISVWREIQTDYKHVAWGMISEIWTGTVWENCHHASFVVTGAPEVVVIWRPPMPPEMTKLASWNWFAVISEQGHHGCALTRNFDGFLVLRAFWLKYKIVIT